MGGFKACNGTCSLPSFKSILISKHAKKTNIKSYCSHCEKYLNLLMLKQNQCPCCHSRLRIRIRNQDAEIRARDLETRSTTAYTITVIT